MRISMIALFPIIPFLGSVLTAQVTREYHVVLKNWPAPLYWQPSPTASEGGEDKAGTLLRSQAVVATPPLAFVAVTPCRVVDTRASQMFAAPFGAPGLTPGPARSFPIQSSTLCSIPSTAQAYSFNVTVIPPGVLGYLTIYPHGQSQPNAVTLDDLLGTIVNNAAIVPAGTVNGSVDVVVNGNTDLVLDINGYYTLPNPTVNTSTGLNALASNTTGTDNTANGYSALFSNTTGSYNTASGVFALDNNTTGGDNTAIGYLALFKNTSGGLNTAIGHSALYSNTTGSVNTATGHGALSNNTTGYYNTANGASSLPGNTTGTYNTATGYQALWNNTTGSNNFGGGSNALFKNTTGSNNTGVGQTLYNNTTGSGNIAIGFNSGSQVTGSNNIDIGNDGLNNESGAIRIGSNLQASFYVAGVRGILTHFNDAMPVLIDSAGQLGTFSSSRRYKEDIQDMAGSSSGLMHLRPVTYRYQRPYADGTKPIDYGLIAEEVAEVYPDLVVKGADGQIEAVQYQKLTPMLLNELQKQQAQITALQKALTTLLSERSPAPISQ